jgi:hypothetical protein
LLLFKYVLTLSPNLNFFNAQTLKEFKGLDISTGASTISNPGNPPAGWVSGFLFFELFPPLFLLLIDLGVDKRDRISLGEEEVFDAAKRDLVMADGEEVLDWCFLKGGRLNLEGLALGLGSGLELE